MSKGVGVMTLAELISALENLEDDLTIYIAADSEWNASSLAIVRPESEDGGLPPDASGMEYFLEVYLAKQVLDVWQNWREGRSPTLQEKCEAIIYYAKNDAYLPG
jgi:hypothetical protein